MDFVNVEVLNVFEHFVTEFDGSTNGLYKIKLNDDTATIFRNGDSWGVLSHWSGKPATECINFMRKDRIEVVENAINEYLNSKEPDCDDYDFRRCMR